MERLMSDDELVAKIDEYKEADHIILQIWEYENNEVRITITAQEGAEAVLTNTKVYHSVKGNLTSDSLQDIKNEGYRLKRKLRRKFRDKKVSSDFRYRG